MMQHPGWLLIIVGLIIAGIGVVWLIAPSIPWLGKLPGDICCRTRELPVLLPYRDVHRDQRGADGHHVAGAVLFEVIHGP